MMSLNAPHGLNFSQPGESANLCSVERDDMINARGLQKRLRETNHTSLVHNETAGPSAVDGHFFPNASESRLISSGSNGTIQPDPSVKKKKICFQRKGLS